MFKILKNFFDFCNEEDRKRFYISIVLNLFQAIFEALKIPAISCMIKALLEGNVTKKTCLTCLGIMLVSVIGSGIFKSKSTMLQTEGGYSTCADKRMQIAEHLRYLPMGYYNDNSLGQIMSVTTNTMQNLENVATRVVMLVCSGLLATAVITLMLLFYDWRIGLILCGGLVVFFMINSGMMKVSAGMAKEKQKKDAALVAKVIEYIQGIFEVKTFNLTGSRSRELNVAIDENENANSAMELKLIPFMTMQSFWLKAVGTVIVLASVLLHINGSMDLLTTIIMIISSYLIYAQLDTAGNYSAMLRTVDVCVSQAQEILDTPQMDISGEDIAPAHFSIKAENISFAYEKRKIIDGISLDIPQRTTTAIVGPSGGGKTTLTSLLSRFWDVDTGKVTLDGRDVRDYSMDALMKNYSFVFQRVYLFADTIANNIRFGQPDAPMEKVIEAAKKACCHDFIMQLPDGYDTVIGEGGASLSGGEKQRISIARAIMKDAPIIVLDEATANVDPENEAELMKAVEALTKEKTIIMIAHRLKTVRSADNILVISGGKIAQQGTHEQLMAAGGIYRSFVENRREAASWRL
ncbi:ABC transporter ATP-binding protein [Ruminococcus albus]|uniref:ABC transporter, ATP-binding protein n=1 Tax=Ruminococcus albus 8 TaxID=246199 RepID=E9SDS6_RUMAL|nr:ABC transporter ATP-binding protein [Ruminococcus albus]EGC02577.1 ABC transporter, ATP-binding protein [Ruminococcus albus 8]MCC3350194.1 ABC transporter ATP-binding protein/permease [Ruminococcus albus 8]